jgi:hypothetical protein
MSTRSQPARSISAHNRNTWLFEMRSSPSPTPARRHQDWRPCSGRPLEGDWPYLWRDATYVKGRRGGRVVSFAVIIAVAADGDGWREAPGPGDRRLRGRDLLG